MANITQSVHHNRDLALQKYLVLHEQHESLRQHLDTLRPLNTSVSTFGSSPSTSPTRSSAQNSPYQPASLRRSSVPGTAPTACFPGTPLETVPDETIVAELAAEEARLFDVNEGIKRALTELLNCEATRVDRTFRTWVMGRLMEAERELRSGRRRRSAPEP